MNRANFAHPIYNKDLSDPKVINHIKEHKSDLIIGGPPCQDFSIAGYREFEGEKANLTEVFCKIITSVLPDYFVMENMT